MTCEVCALDGVETYFFLQGGQTSNGTKQFESTGKGKGSPARRGAHLLAALYLSKNLKGGPRTRLTAADGAITQFMRPADRHEHHVRFALMQIMTSSPHASAAGAYVRSFLAGFRINYAPPALGTVTLHLLELASFISSILVDLFTAAANDYMGVPWAHVSIDMWTAPGSRASYGALILRFTDFGTLAIKKKSLGVWACPGKHNHKAIVKWQQEGLGRFGISEGDIGWTTTDSGSNVRKAEADLDAPWIPCAAHALNLAVRKALGASGEAANQRAIRVAAGGRAARRHLKACPNPAARELLTRLRATTTFFKHSDAEAQRLSAIIVSGDPAIRGLVSEVATHWGSTYLSLARLYAMWPRISIFFRSTKLTADQRKRRVDHRDWDKMRHLIAILTHVFEATEECQRTSATLADIFSLVVALRKTLLHDTIVAPKFPEHPMAAGSDSIESLLQENPDDDVIELDNHLYPSEAVYMDTRDGY